MQTSAPYFDLNEDPSSCPDFSVGTKVRPPSQFFARDNGPSPVPIFGWDNGPSPVLISAVLVLRRR